MSKTSSAESIAGSLQQFAKSKELPPVHRWNPDFCGDIDIHIHRDGRWFYMGSEITRPALVRLFSTVLRHDDDGCYYLVTPVEKVRIKVDDAPFVITSMVQRTGDKGVEIVFTTNVGDRVILDTEHPLRVMENAVTGEPSPYIRVRDKLDALLHRNVFYQLIAKGVEQKVGNQVELLISSRGEQYALGRYPDE